MELFEKVINSKLLNLTHIPRWSGCRYIRQESVSDHVWGMTALALELVPALNKVAEKFNCEPIDLKDVIYRIQLHDTDESVAMDIPRPLKYHDDMIHDAIERATYDLMKYEFTDDMINQVSNAKDKNKLEGFIVAYLDALQAELYVNTEIRLGNNFIKSEIPNGLNVMNELINSKNKVFSITHYHVMKVLSDFNDKCVEYFNSFK